MKFENFQQYGTDYWPKLEERSSERKCLSSGHEGRESESREGLLKSWWCHSEVFRKWLVVIFTYFFYYDVVFTHLMTV